MDGANPNFRRVPALHDDRKQPGRQRNDRRSYELGLPDHKCSLIARIKSDVFLAAMSVAFKARLHYASLPIGIREVLTSSRPVD